MEPRGFVAGLVLAAGGSHRLGRPKQLLELGGGTLLDATLTRVRACGLDQLIVAVGRAAPDVRAEVDLSGCTVIESADHASGCSTSIAAALPVVDPRAIGLVLFLGDQPDVAPECVAALIHECTADAAPLGVCGYDDGRGHPLWLGRAAFAELAGLRGDKGVWQLIESGRLAVTEARVDGPIPLDVDTWADYRRLLESRR
jgi:molybdenum cofactor cytidylyltransferase